jgi:hypothetical protein
LNAVIYCYSKLNWICGGDSKHPTSEEQIMNIDPESKEGQEQGRRDTEGRPIIRAVDEQKKEAEEAKEKPVDPE